MTLKTILCVDDSPLELDRMTGPLQAAGYGVVTARNGREAVAQASAAAPDLILMDVNMPEMDGFQATRVLAGQAQTRAIPVVLVTSKAQKADRVWAQMLGVRGYVTKPYTAQTLLALVETLV